VTLLQDLDDWVRLLTLMPILVCSIIGSGITIAKWLHLRRARASGAQLIEVIRGLDDSTDVAPALAAARVHGSIPGRLVEYTLAIAPAPRSRLVEHVEHGGRQLARAIERGLDTLALLAMLGPLLGLFGTVVGIVLVFDRLAGAEGVVSPSQLAGGIGTALYTTVAGLIVGMCALVSHRFLASRADEVIAQMETLGQALVDLRTRGAP
jgi:biopolymer transport protein ExbB